MSPTDHYHRCLRIHWSGRLHLLVWSPAITPERATDCEGWKTQYGCPSDGHHWPCHYPGWNRSIQSIQLGIPSSFSYRKGINITKANISTSNEPRPDILVLRSNIEKLCIYVERSRDQPIRRPTHGVHTGSHAAPYL